MRSVCIHRIGTVLLILMSVMVLSCQKGLSVFVDSENPASLTLSLSADKHLMVTKGIEDLDDNGAVTELEEIIDGKKMYRLAVFLMDGTTTVRSTVLEINDNRFVNNNSGAVISFENLDYSKTYTLYAVANYGKYNDTTNGHLQNVENVTGNINVTANGGICNSKTPYPLSLKMDVTLQPGANRVSGELLRSYARIRLNVRNSSTKPLRITSLQFENSFAQSQANLFEQGGTANTQLQTTSADAITPFVVNTVLDPTAVGTNVVEHTIFDAYILESNSGNYNYTIGLEYIDGVNTKYSLANTSVTNPNNIESGEMYVVCNPRSYSKRYLYANGTSVAAGTSYKLNGELNNSYIWKFTKSVDNKYCVESMGNSGYYINGDEMDENSVPLTNSFDARNNLTLSTDKGYLRMSNDRFSIGVDYTGNVKGMNDSWGANDIELYKVIREEVETKITYTEKIPIRTINSSTGESVPLTTIKRNDFIEILVNVYYNEKNGTLQFEVSNWDNVNGYIEFN